MKDSFILYIEHKEIFKMLTDEEAGKLIKVIFEYEDTGQVDGLDKSLMLAFFPIKNTLDRNREKYNNVVERNKRNIEKRWEKENTKNTTGKTGKKENTKNTDNEHEHDNEYVNDNNNIYGQSTRSKPGQSTDWENKFNEFYSLYPKKVKKQQVKKWFEKVKPSNELFSSIMDSLEQFRASADWQKDGGQFIPHPSTWLNQSRWEDEVKAEEKSAIDSWYERMSKLEGADNDT